MDIPQFKPWIGKEEYKSIESCFDDAWITEGPKSREFSERLLELIGAKYGVFAPNGTLALYLALRAIGVGEGDEVIVPDFTFLGSASSVEMSGARPVFVDVNRKNFQIDLKKADKIINANTKAIMPVHIYGTMVNMDEVVMFAEKHNLMIVEDAAQAIGVRFRGQHAGTFGEVGTFSFFADKTITTGEGGFVVTNNESIYENLMYLRNQGRIDRGSFIHPEIGYNFRMTDVQCAIGLVQLNKLPEIISRKQKVELRYRKNLSSVSSLNFFEAELDADLIPFRVGILSKENRELMNYMKENGVEVRTFFYPLHRQPCFSYLKKGQAYFNKLNDDFFPNSVYGYENGVCLPSFPTITNIEVDRVSEVIIEFYEKNDAS